MEAPTTIETEVCIVGSGAAGITIAHQLSAAGIRCVVLEAGQEFFEKDIQEQYRPSKEHPLYESPLGSRLRMLGGSTNHWENNTAPFDPIDFKKRPWVPNSGWPIMYSEVAQYYPAAAEYCGAGSLGYLANTWSKKFDQPTITEDSSAVKTGISVFAMPPRQFYRDYKSDLDASGFVDVYSGCNVVDLEFDAGNETVTQLYFETKPGLRHSISAKQFVLGMGGIENSRMLLYFNQKYGNAIGNQGDCVGRYYMDHPVIEAAHFFPTSKRNFQLYKENFGTQQYVSGYLQLTKEHLEKEKLNNIRMPLIPRDNYYMSDGVSSFHIMKNAISEGELPDDLGTHIINFLSDIDMVAEGVSRQTFEKPIFDHANDVDAFIVYMMLEQTPAFDNRIRLGTEQDRFGIPRIEIDWELKQNDIDNMWSVLETLAQDLGAREIGRLKLLKERSSRIFSEHMGFGHHHIGGTRMSDTPETGVVDTDQKVFGTNNLYIAGSSVFPTGSHVPPTLTIVATSIRLAAHLKEVNHA